MPEIDVPMLLFVSAGMVLAVSFAVLAGILCARVLFHATRSVEEEQP